jgi:hypothetical protein
MHAATRLRSRLRRAALVAVVAATAAAGLGAAGPAAADTPNKRGVLVGEAEAAPASPAYEAPRPVGAGDGRKIG